MDKTQLFRYTADSFSVAQAGYDAMMKGELEVIAGLTTAQKLMIKSYSLRPQKDAFETG